MAPVSAPEQPLFPNPASRPLAPRQDGPGLVRSPGAEAGAPGQAMATYQDYAPRQEAGRRWARVITVTSPKGGTGKALDLDEVVATPTGWARFGDLVAGDELFDERGDVCRVVALSETWTDRPTYRLTFSDGTSVVADAAHEWPTLGESDEISSVLTTEEISVLLAERSIRTLVIRGVLALEEKPLRTNLYEHGLLGGRMAAIADERAELVLHGGGGAARSVGGAAGLEAPEDVSFLRAGLLQRLALLQGFMDAAGGVSVGAATYEYPSSSGPGLCEFLADLVRGLGGVATTSEEGGLSFTLPAGLSPFRDVHDSASTRAHQPTRSIVSCESVGLRATRCIEVDSPSHLFLAGRGMVPTHNSTLTLNMAAYLGLRVKPLGKRVCVIDANFQQADAGKLLNQYSPNITNIIRDTSSLAPNAIERYLVHREDLNLSVLLGPPDVGAANPTYLNAKLYNQVIDALRPNFDYIIIDTPVAEVFHEMFRGFLLTAADYIIVPLTPSYPTLMNVENWLRTVTQPRYTGGDDVDPQKVGIVINQLEEGIHLDEPEIRRELSAWHFIGSVPRSRAWINAVNNNELVATKNYHELNRAFSEILFAATGEQALLVGLDQPAGPAKKGGLFGGLLGRKKKGS